MTRASSVCIRVLTVFGTRPEAIKLAPVIAELRRHPEDVDCRLCVTAQHREMLDQVLRVFDLRPDYDLNIMVPGQTLAEVTCLVLRGIEQVLCATRPNLVLVQGDTSTVFATSLAAYYHHTPVGHVEAGLRTGDKHRPFPEEMNRRLTSALADLHFAPTETARRNLLREGVRDGQIVVTGNTVIDALLDVTARPFQFTEPPLTSLGGRVVLITAHRRESFGEPLRSICRAIVRLAARFSEISFVYPVHLNPRVQSVAGELLSGIHNVLLTKPLDYLPFAHLLKRAELILTDSGGIQEEAPALGKPVLVLREVTERQEAIEAGGARLVGTDEEKIVSETTRLLCDRDAYQRMASAPNPFGDGRAAERIVNFILSHANGLGASKALHCRAIDDHLCSGCLP
ncbi:MAG TPA: UDP-N-acetylglucosamine 2-epimerase (non-hydrolyzing) [Anaerolineae bacterium]|nr:UDP-N-acetylglucosamine 2-epimerase (non-hydrolyzing) [Anaerolineae bacterium]